MFFGNLFQVSALVSSAILLLAGCRTLDSGTSGVLDATTPVHKILLVGAGGWGSCGSGNSPFDQRIYDSFSVLAKDLSAHAKVDYMISCSGNVSPAKLVANTWYAGPDGQVWKIKARDFPSYVYDHIKKTNPTQVYMIGHSYGGWVVLNATNAGVPSTAVFGLDPIDAAECLPINNFFLGIGIGSSKCVVAPYFDYGNIGKYTQKLYQMWQPLGPIHSVAVNHSIAVNREFDINHSSFGGLQAEKMTYAHRMIGSEPTAWGAICQTIFKINSWDANECRMIETDGAGKFSAFVTGTPPILDHSGISIPAPVIVGPTPGAKRITCSKTPVSPQGVTINWRVSVVEGSGGWHIDAKRDAQHLYDETDTSRVLVEQNTNGGLKNIVHPSNTLWLSLKPSGNGGFVGRFFTQKFNYDIQDMTCVSN